MALMHLPDRSKTWTIIGNTLQPSGATASQHAAQAFVTAKNLFLGFGSRTTCSGSSDSATAGLDGADRIVDKTKVVGAAGGSAHSWMVLKLTSTGQQLCVDFNSATGAYVATMVWSPGGLFTGGSITARPTATDEIVNRNTLNWLVGNGVNPVNVTAWCSDDGDNLTILFYVFGGVVAGWLLGRIFDARSWITQPYYCSTYGDGLTINFNLPSNFYAPLTANAFAAKGPANAAVRLQCTGQLGTGGLLLSLAAVQNTLTGMWEVEQPGFWNPTNPDSGPWGRIPDHLLVNGPAQATIGTDPGSPTGKIAIVLGSWCMPWRNTVWAGP